jgi:anti-sigma28 factor (negative regulator of flagellin synthesis)
MIAGECHMSSINSVTSASPLQQVIANPIQKSLPTDAPAPTPAQDKLEISGMSHLLATLKTNDIRADKVASVRGQIDAGTYESDDKLNTAINGLLDDLNK